MRLRDNPPVHLAYCLNVHAGETWPETLEAIRRHTLAIRNLVAPDRPFGLGLRLSNLAASQLEHPETLGAFRQFLGEHGLYAFTINGFPYGTFHQSPVKTAVYAPDWRTPERLAYTLRLARLLAELLPEGVDGSISTLPVTYRAWETTAPDMAAIAANLADTAWALETFRDRTGKDLHIGLEPEPDCLLAVPADAVTFFDNTLLPHGGQRLMTSRGCSRAAAERILRERIGICLDTGHMAVEFLSPHDAMRQLRDAGLRLSKLQLSAALEAPATREGHARLADFTDAVYLHQTRLRHADARVSHYADLDAALASTPPEPGGVWRTHCHVPLHLRDQPDLRSTAGLLDHAFWQSALSGCVSHFEIETYTFDVLPAAIRREGIESSIRREYAWVMDRMAATLGGQP